MASSESMFADWQSELRTRGFGSAGTGGRQGIYMTRKTGPIVQAVGVMIAESRGGDFNIQLHLSMPLPFADPPYDVILLSGDVSSADVRIEHPWNHDPAFPTWWPPDRASDGLSAVVQHGIDWLEHYSDLTVLAKHFEEEFQSYDDKAREYRNKSFADRLRRLVGKGRQPPNRGYREHLLWLAMVYENRGLAGLARDRLEAYAAATEKHLSTNERTRLDRHREALRKQLV